MGKPILLLRLEGPLQSWGVRSRWSRRDTGPEPTKSAIIGMLGAAAGILRPDWRSESEPDRTLEEWDKALRFGVRVDRPGVIETDYHTVQGPLWDAEGNFKKTKKEVKYSGGKWVFWETHNEETWRDYLHDAAFLVALEGDCDLLKNLEAHLHSPKWPIFLGRKACLPSRPVLERLTTEYADLEGALKKEPWSAPRQIAHLSCYRRRGEHAPCATCRRLGPAQELTAWIEDPAGDYERPDAVRLNQLRFYDFRRCSRLNVPTDKLTWRIP